MSNIYDLQENGMQISTTVPVSKVLHAFFDFMENEHVKGMIEIEVAKEDHQNALYSKFCGDQITISGNDSNIILSGFIEKVEFRVEGTYLSGIIHCVSGSIGLDRKRNSRSFQDLSMTYSQVLQKMLEQYENADFSWQTVPDSKIKHPIVQYNETDWEFAKRLATHFHTVIYAENQKGNFQFHFGCKKGKVRSMKPESNNFITYKFSQNYYKEGGLEEGISREEATFLEFTSEEDWKIGDVVPYEGWDYSVYRKRVIFDKGETTYSYLLGKGFFLYRKKRMNEALMGASVKGIVKNSEKENIYLQLEIDHDEMAQYPWAWVPETGNISYCMPEKGTKALLCFPSGDERDGIVQHLLRDNAESDVYSDVQNREMHTLKDKKIGLYPKKMFLEGKEKNVAVELNDESGIQFNSNRAISMSATQGIYINGKKNSISAPIEIVCRTKQSNIEINRDFNFYAPGGVKKNAQGGEIAELQLSASKEKKSESWQMAYTAMAAVPTMDFAKAEQDEVIDLMANGAIPKIAMGKATVAMSDVMEGKPESQARYPESLKSMEIYTVKGGYVLPLEKG